MALDLLSCDCPVELAPNDQRNGTSLEFSTQTFTSRVSNNNNNLRPSGSMMTRTSICFAMDTTVPVETSVG